MCQEQKNLVVYNDESKVFTATKRLPLLMNVLVVIAYN